MQYRWKDGQGGGELAGKVSSFVPRHMADFPDQSDFPFARGTSLRSWIVFTVWLPVVILTF